MSEQKLINKLKLWLVLHGYSFKAYINSVSEGFIPCRICCNDDALNTCRNKRKLWINDDLDIIIATYNKVIKSHYQEGSKTYRCIEWIKYV